MTRTTVSTRSAQSGTTTAPSAARFLARRSVACMLLHASALLDSIPLRAKTVRMTPFSFSVARQVFGHVVYHIIKAPQGAGDTQFAHLGVAYDKLPSPAVQARLRRCASVNSNGGAVHPMVHQHPLSGRLSLYLHLGMTGAILETLAPEDAARAGARAQSEGTDDGGFGDGSTPADLAKAKEGTKYDRLKHVRAWHDGEMDRFFSAWSAHLDRPDVSYSHKWQQGDVIIIDNLAVAHKAAPGAHTLR